ncbi:MAG: DUF4249 domain-containing protein [Bacteroidota bacterium]
MKTPLYLLLLVFLVACIEPFEVDIPAGERFLVVEGFITDQAEAYTVKLSYSSPVSAEGFEVVSNASVSVERQSGASFDFTETTQGTFQSDPLNFQAQIGESYRLLIEINGQSYASSFVPLKASPPIGELRWQFDQRVTAEGPLAGIQIFVDTEDPEANSRYYRYQWVETWKYGIALPANYIYIGNDQSQTIQAFPTCYATEISQGINIASSTQNEGDRLVGHPLTYVTTQTNRLDKRYSILVKQYVMEEEEFLFWKTIKESTENVGSLFDRQPQSRLGNLQNINDPTEPVLGYFSASAVSEKRLYVNRSELPPTTRVNNGFRECFLTLDTLSLLEAGVTPEDRDATVFGKINNGQVFYDFRDRPFITGYIFTTKDCSDCRALGGSEIKPDFWVE